jgi:membrane protein implicated in regulation of membrane protease activity
MNFDSKVLLVCVLFIILFCVDIFYFKVFRRARLDVSLNLASWSWFIIGILFLLLYLGGLLPTLILVWTSPESLLNWEDWEKVTAYGTVSLSVGTALLAISAFLALFVARNHLDKVAEVSKASFLLDLEKQSTSEPMIKAQTTLAETWQEIEINVSKSYPTFGEEAKHRKISEEFHSKLQDCRFGKNTDEHSKYHELMRNCDFFETVGVMVDKRYIDIEDVASRFEIAITRVHQCFQYHIEQRRIEMWASRKLFQHIEPLYKRTKEYIDKEGA